MLKQMFLAGLAVFFGGINLSNAADEPVRTPLVLTGAQTQFLALEPILVKVNLQDKKNTLPAVVGDPKSKTTLRFDIQPPVKPRSGAKPLPLEAQRGAANNRFYDLLEWYQFPAEGKFTVEAVLEQGTAKLTSKSIIIELRRPDKKDAEWGPVDRLHHIPWSNYVTDAFCGDTFDVVKRWPESRLTPYCTYYNGLHHLHKKEYDKAIDSLQTVVKQFPKFVLAADANWAIADCLRAQGKKSEADAQVKACEARYPNRLR